MPFYNKAGKLLSMGVATANDTVALANGVGGQVGEAPTPSRRARIHRQHPGCRLDTARQHLGGRLRQTATSATDADSTPTATWPST